MRLRPSRTSSGAFAELRVRALAAAIAASLCNCAHPARPLSTDDARIVDGKACQVESWWRRNQESAEYWAIPACNPTGNAELSIGGAETRENGTTHTSVVLLQAKTLFRKLDTNGFGIGAAFGYAEPKTVAARGVGPNLYGYIPASFSFADDALVIHTNIGTVRPADEQRHRLTWGVGSETRIHPSAFIVAEVFRLEASGPHYQAGIRYWLIPNRAQIDATVGDRIGHSNGGRWFSIGLRLLSPPFLP
jgi:hypothetical protein